MSRRPAAYPSWEAVMIDEVGPGPLWKLRGDLVQHRLRVVEVGHHGAGGDRDEGDQ